MAEEKSQPALVKQRGKIKGCCTRIKTYVDACDPSSISPALRAQIEERRAKLDTHWSEYDSIQSILESIDETEVNDRIAFEEAFYNLCGKMREMLDSPSVARSTSATGSSASVRGVAESPIHVQLPRLSLPKFSGKYEEWFPFFDTFNSIIHSNVSLNNTQKFQYLRTSLIGDANNVIHSLEITDANYEIAWDLLKQRYDNKRVIVHTHIKAILDLPSMSKENSEELRQIVDGVARHIHALEALQRPTSQWDDLLVYILSSKLDGVTSREWQISLSGFELPTLKQFRDFITHRCQILEATNKSSDANTKNINTRSQPGNKRQTACATTTKPQCNYCKEDHVIYYCKDFLALPISQRITEIRNRKLCTNCLRCTDHKNVKCPCQSKHNTLLHLPFVKSGTAADASNNKSSSEQAPAISSESTVLNSHVSNLPSEKYVMLSTAVIYAYDKHGARKSCRVLLDSGSQASFISKHLMHKLGLQPCSSNIIITGINGTATGSTQLVQVKIQSRINSHESTIDCAVTDQITSKLPAYSFKRNVFQLPRNIELADPHFNISSEIDILIGAELFWDLLCVGQIGASSNHPTLQKTRFGWILAGRSYSTPANFQKIQSFHTSIQNDELHEQLSKFWQLDEPSTSSDNYTFEERLCEEHFLKTVSQNDQGRYVVELPVKNQVFHKLGDSREAALQRFHGLEKRFKRDPILKARYTEFINEYLTLGHMRLIEETVSSNAITFYLPHHCVFKNSKHSTKIRVVFDASCKSSRGLSLNDVLLVGPVVQQDLMTILMRFRTFAYVFVADIIKMYRQILVNPSQTSLQRILWRPRPDSKIETYELQTVTYGTSPASFLATRQ